MSIFRKVYIFILSIKVVRGMAAFNFLNSIDHLERKCGKCGSKIDWGTTTEYDDELEAHKCKSCGEIVKALSAKSD
ncbi:MAG: hypothetical protein MAG795_00809 [Candidatus Woesearchaeota archaeon]|nr:hypothetical protein [Candidatus Woesearchaeota archaeon]